VNTEIRWRFVTLQAILVIVLAAAGGFAIAEGNFATSTVKDELVGQQITFPTTAQLASDKETATYGSDFTQYAGQTVDNGPKAQAYANHYIAVHLNGVANGQTYSQVSGQAMAVSGQIASTPATDPGYAALQTKLATLNGQANTLFKGEALRSMLLNAYGWYQVGTYTIYMGFGLLVAALAALGALVFELFVAGRKPETFKVAQKIAA
jgi:hypothetical protein